MTQEGLPVQPPEDPSCGTLRGLPGRLGGGREHTPPELPKGLN